MELDLEKKRRGTSEIDEEKWVYDSSVDHKGRVPIRASTGVWKASLFIIAIEFSERFSYFGIATNLVIYLTKILHQDIKTAAKNVNYWSGVTTMMPLVGGLIADAYLGRFSTVLVSSIIYLLGFFTLGTWVARGTQSNNRGLGLLTMSEFVPSLKPCKMEACDDSTRIHEVVFFLAIYMISIGTGGHKPSLESFGADQFDDDHPEERKKKMSYFNWWSLGLCLGVILGVTVVVYIQDNVSWGVADIILTSTMAASIFVFVLGRPFYRYRAPEGSPLTPMLQVLVAAVAKRNLPQPSDPNQLYEVSKSRIADKRLLFHTNKLTFFDKAAIIEDKEMPLTVRRNPWRLATVTQVEEMKLLLNMIPIWLTILPFGISVAQTTTFFIKQGSIMDRKLSHSFSVPPAAIFSFAAMAMLISLPIYDRIFVPVLRRATGNERGISILQRIGIGMVLSILAMATAAIVEQKRLNVAQREQTSVVSMSVFWLAPQFVIVGIADGFTLVGLQEYFYDQVPDRMRSLGIAIYLSVIGVASFLSSFLITIVDHLTEKGGSGWFANDLNKSRLDLYYWLLVCINGVNLCAFVYLATKYSYKNVQRRVANKGGGVELGP